MWLKKGKESARILFFYPDLHTGFDPEPVFPKGPGARTHREPAEADWRLSAGPGIAHRIVMPSDDDYLVGPDGPAKLADDVHPKVGIGWPVTVIARIEPKSLEMGEDDGARRFELGGRNIVAIAAIIPPMCEEAISKIDGVSLAADLGDEGGALILIEQQAAKRMQA